MRKSVWILAFSFILACQGASFAASSVDALVQKLVEKGILTDKEATQLKGEIATNENAAIEAGSKKQMPDWLSGIKFSGDFRLRDQWQHRALKTAANDFNRNRGRFRARLNVEDQINDKIKIVFGLATEGGSDNGTLANGRSNNVTFGGNGGTNSGTFAKPYIAINKAYAVYTPAHWATLIGGKMDNPIWEPATLTWDPDITPEGGAIKLEKKLNDMVTPFSTNAIFVLKDVSPSSSERTNPYIFVSQEGIKGNLNEKVYYKLAGTWQNINNPGHNALDNIALASGNTPSSTAGQAYSYNYNILQGSVDLGMNDPLGEMFPIYIPQIGVFGQYIKNVDPSHNNAGWQMGGYLGNSSINGWGTWRLQSYYRVLERDSWIDALTDDDFYSGDTNTAGWRSQLDFGLAKNTWLTLSYFNTRVYKSFGSPAAFAQKAPEHLVQADLNFKF